MPTSRARLPSVPPNPPAPLDGRDNKALSPPRSHKSPRAGGRVEGDLLREELLRARQRQSDADERCAVLVRENAYLREQAASGGGVRIPVDCRRCEEMREENQRGAVVLAETRERLVAVSMLGTRVDRLEAQHRSAEAELWDELQRTHNLVERAEQGKSEAVRKAESLSDTLAGTERDLRAAKDEVAHLRTQLLNLEREVVWKRRAAEGHAQQLEAARRDLVELRNKQEDDQGSTEGMRRELDASRRRVEEMQQFEIRNRCEIEGFRQDLVSAMQSLAIEVQQRGKAEEELKKVGGREAAARGDRKSVV